MSNAPQQAKDAAHRQQLEHPNENKNIPQAKSRTNARIPVRRIDTRHEGHDTRHSSLISALKVTAFHCIGRVMFFFFFVFFSIFTNLHKCTIFGRRICQPAIMINSINDAIDQIMRKAQKQIFQMDESHSTTAAEQRVFGSKSGWQ